MGEALQEPIEKPAEETPAEPAPEAPLQESPPVDDMNDDYYNYKYNYPYDNELLFWCHFFKHNFTF